GAVEVGVVPASLDGRKQMPRPCLPNLLCGLAMATGCWTGCESASITGNQKDGGPPLDDGSTRDSEDHGGWWRGRGRRLERCPGCVNPGPHAAERATGLEPATFGLGSRRSTN